MDVILFLFIAVYIGLGRKGRIKLIKKEKKVFFTFVSLGYIENKQPSAG